MLAERGLDISYETIRRWFLKPGTPIAANLRKTRPTPGDHRRLDEMVIMIHLWLGNIAQTVLAHHQVMLTQSTDGLW